MMAKRALLPPWEPGYLTLSFYAWVCSPLLLYMRTPRRNMTPPLSPPPAVLSIMPYRQWMLCWMNRWRNKWESEQIQNSHLTLPELICFAGREYGCVPDPVLGYIPSAANKKHIKYHMWWGLTSDFSYIQKKVNSPKEVKCLVVSCSTRKIKLDWETLC